MSCQRMDWRWSERGWRQAEFVMAGGLLLAVCFCTSRAEAQLDKDISACMSGSVAAPESIVAAARDSLEKGGASSSLSTLRALAKSYPQSTEILYYLSVAEQRSGENVRAVAAAKAAYFVDPECRPVIEILGRLLEAQGSFEEAAAIYSDAVAMKPDDVSYRRELASALVASGALDKAEPHLRWLTETLPQDAGAQAAWAEVQGWLGNAQDCVTGFRRALAMDPSVMSAQRRRTFGDALRAVQQPDLAVEQYNLALKDAPRDAALLMVRSYALVDLGHPGEAVEGFRMVLKRDSKNVDALAGLARALHAGSRSVEAIETYKKALTLTPDDAGLRLEAVQVTASVESRRGDALDLLAPLLEGDSPDPKAVFVQAEILSWIPERRGQSLVVLSQLLARDPDRTDAWELAHKVVMWMPPQQDQLPWLERLRARYPDDLDLVTRLATALAQSPDRLEEAVHLLDEVLEQKPIDSEVHALRAELLLRMQPRDEAAAAEGFRKAASFAPRDADIQARAGYGLVQLGLTEDALTCFSNGVLADPNDLGCVLGRIDALTSLARYEEATVQIQDALSHFRDSEDRDLLLQRRSSLENVKGRIEAARLAAAGRPQEAEALYRALLKKSPRDIDTWISLGALLSETGDYAGALGAFQTALGISPSHIGAMQGASGALTALKRYEEARTLIQRELEIAPTQDAQRRLKKVELFCKVESALKTMQAGDASSAAEMLGELYLVAPDEPLVVASYAEALMATGQYAAAADAYVRSAGLEPGNQAALRGAANALWAAGRREEARYYLQEVRRLADEKDLAEIDALRLSWEVQEAELEKSSGNLPGALERYRAAYAMAPTTGFVLKGIGGLYWSNGQLDLASKFFVQAATLYPEDVEAAGSAAEILMARNQPEMVIALLEKNPTFQTNEALKTLYDQARLARDLAGIEAAWRRGEYAVAESLAGQVERKYPKCVEPRLKLAHLFGSNGQHGQAIRWYYKALEVAPDDQSALLGLIATLQTIGRFVEADDLIAQARARDKVLDRTTPELDRLEAVGQAVRAEVFLRRGERAKALDAYAQAIVLGFDEPWIYMNIARVYAANGQNEDALAVYELILKEKPVMIDALRGKGFVLLSLGKAEDLKWTIGMLEENAQMTEADRSLKAEWMKLGGDLEGARALYQELYESNPGNPDICRGLIGCYLALDRPRDALNVVMSILPEAVNDPPLLESLAAALGGLKRSDLAVPVLHRLNRYWPSPERAGLLEAAVRASYVESAEAYKARGDLKRARRLYLAAFRRWPESADVMRGLAGVEASAGNAQEARKYYERALEKAPDDPVAISGHSATRASLGEVLSAQATLQEAWDRTSDPLIGLELADLLIGQERYFEARRVLRSVEAEMDETSDDKSGTLPDAFSETSSEAPVESSAEASSGPGLDADGIGDRFFAAWQKVPRGTPPNLTQDKVTVLPSWPPEILKGYAALGSPQDGRRFEPSSESTSPLPDIAPALTVPVALDVGNEATPASLFPTVTSTRLDLRLVEHLLQELKTDPSALVASAESRGFPEYAGQADGEGSRPEVPTASNATVTGLEGPEATNEDAPFVPSVSRTDKEQRVVVALPTPHDRLVSLNQKLEWANATRFLLGGWIDGRSGEAGTTQRVAAFGDIRLRVFPSPALYLEPYVAPGFVTNGLDTQQGTMAGLGFGTRPDRFGLYGQVGTSPMGFVGGFYTVGLLSLHVDLVDRLKVGVEGAIEPVTDSLLSWAGEVRTDGSLHGRVSRSRLGGELGLNLDGRTSLYVGGDVARYVDVRDDSNLWRNGRVGLDHEIPLEGGPRLGLGVNVTAFGFEKQIDASSAQLDETPWEGGYFSPQLFVVAKGRGVYSDMASDQKFRYRVLLELGLQYTAGVETDYLTPGTRPIVTLEFRVSYRLSRTLDLGAQYVFDNVGADWIHNRGWIYLEKRFGIEQDF